MTLLLTHDEFIERSKAIHGNIYSYDKTTYVDLKTFVIVTCLEHGDFEVSPIRLLHGSKCIKCSPITNTSSVKQDIKLINAPKFVTDVEQFIRKANKIHNYRYDYSMIYNPRIVPKVEVICLTHGSFWIHTHNHLQHRGCPKCNGSLGEKIVIDILNQSQCSFATQFTFATCKYKKRLRFDFKVNIKDDLEILLEVDGDQHRRPVCFGTHMSQEQANENFVNGYRRDMIKNQWSISNGMHLYRVLLSNSNKSSIVLFQQYIRSIIEGELAGTPDKTFLVTADSLKETSNQLPSLAEVT